MAGLAPAILFEAPKKIAGSSPAMKRASGRDRAVYSPVVGRGLVPSKNRM